MDNKFYQTQGPNGFYGPNSSGLNDNPGANQLRNNSNFDRRKQTSQPHMMPSIIPAEGDNLTHSTHTHRSEDGSLSPNYVNRYSIGKGAKKVRTRIPHRISGNNNDL